MVSIMEGISDFRQPFVGFERGAIHAGGTRHAERLVGPLRIELAHKIVEAGLLLEEVHAWRPGRFFLQGKMHPFVAPVLLGMTGFDALDRDAQPQPPHGQLGEVEQAVGAGEGETVVGSDGIGQSPLLEQLEEGREGCFFTRRLQGFAHQDEARSLIGDGQGVTVLCVAELELALEISAPQGIGLASGGERRAHGLVAPRLGALHKSMAVEHGVDGAFGWNAHITSQAFDEDFSDFAGTPVGLLALDAHNQGFDLAGELIGIAPWPTGSIAQGLEAVLLIAIEDFVAGFARDAELEADVRHRLALE